MDIKSRGPRPPGASQRVACAWCDSAALTSGGGSFENNSISTPCLSPNVSRIGGASAPTPRTQRVHGPGIELANHKPGHPSRGSEINTDDGVGGIITMTINPQDGNMNG